MEIVKQVMGVRIGQLMINDKMKKGDFKVPIHLALGHEAIAVAVDSVMDKEVKIILNHRNIHYNLAISKDLKRHVDEYLLKQTGYAKGKLGSMNLANEEKGIVYTSSILGNNLSVATGVALSKKAKKEDGIVIVITGDGAIEEGSFYESLLFSKSNDLPLLIIIENNEWSLATKINERRCPINIKKFSETLGINYELFSSNDVYEYAERLKESKELALKNKTPLCLEVKLTTLGYWYQKTEEFPNGKFINYHAGPAPDISLKDGPVIKKDQSDPVFVINKYFDESALETAFREILTELERELL
jgi:TPP-dependent pyruvate/acetoin dehydrogenase alpha subunit